MDQYSPRKRFHGTPRAAGPPVKLSDVAALAGVSPATASRVLNRPEKVGQDMRERVQAAASSLGYVRDAAARALASRRSRTMGAVVPTLSNPIFAAGVQGLESRLNEHGYALLVASSDYRIDKELRHATTLVERGVEGLMLMGTEHHASLHALLETRGIPCINTWVYDEGAAQPCIGFDNVEAEGRLTRYLLDLGHRDFAMIAGISEGNDRVAARVTGVREALARHGLALETGRLVEMPYGVRAGRDGLRAVLDGPARPRPTAVICGNDLLAFGALFEAQAMGLDVPGDISIVGFDDNELASHIPPGLTTMHVPSAEMGELAADYLVNRDQGAPAQSKTRVEVRLVVRGSSGPPRG